MKIRIDMLALAVAVFLLGTFTQCKKSSPDEEQKPDYSIDPAQANELSKVIKFGNAVTVSGALPTTTSTNAVTITHVPSMSVSTGGATTYLPLVFEGAQDVQKAFIIVKGAT